MTDTYQRELMLAATDLACRNAAEGGAPFGAVIARNGEIISTGVNTVHVTNDPTGHAELLAIREAAQKLGRPNLSDCQLYASGEPCPMCLAAALWANLPVIYVAYRMDYGARYGFASPDLYRRMTLPREELFGSVLQHVVDDAFPDPYRIWHERFGQ